MFNLYITKNNGYELNVVLDDITKTYYNVVEIFNNFIDELYAILFERDNMLENYIIKIKKIDDASVAIIIDNLEVQINISYLIEKFLKVSKEYFTYTSIDFAKNFHYEKYSRLKTL